MTAAIIGALVLSQVQRDAIAETDLRLLADATRSRRMLAEHFAGDTTLDTLRAHADAYAAAVGVRLTAVGRDGTVLADSSEDPARMDNHAGRPEIAAALAGARGQSTRLSPTVGVRTRYLALPVTVNGETVAVARAAMPLAEVWQHLAALRRALVLGAGIASLAALVLAFAMARRTTRPLREMKAVAEAMAAGDYHRRVAARGRRDELGALARAFNAMSRQLREQVETITLEHAKLTAILGSMVEGVVAVDRDERILHVNQVAGALLGVDPERAAGRPIWEVTRVREISEALYETLEQEVPAQREIRLPGRADRIIEARTMPLRDGASGSHGAVIVLGDVTQLRRLETVRQDFVGNVSHELKTPVAAIRGLVETVLEDPDMPAETRERFLEKVAAQTERLTTLVTDLLSLSRLDAPESGVQTEIVDVREPVAEAVRAFAPSSEAKGVTVVCALSAAPLVVRGDREALHEAVGNLLDNAIKYSPDGETVTVRVARESETGAGGGSGADPEWVTIAVTDRGPGIAKKDQQRIFERFYRVDRARSRALGGTGLGLAIVKHIALDLGGAVEVESEPGAGSTFRIRLPLLPEE